MQPENSNNPQPQQDQATTFSQANLQSKRKKLFIGITALVVILLGSSAGAYFGIYVPNKPENLWNRALINTGKGYDKLVDYSEKQKDVQGGELKGSYKLDADQLVVDGSIESKYNDKSSVSKIDAGTSGARVNLDVQTNKADNSKYPDIYVKVSGVKGLDKILGSEAGGLGSALSSFDNQWYTIDHTLFDQLEKSSADSSSSAPQSLNQDDINKIAESIGKVNKEYLFTDNADKAVFKRTQNIGKEKVDDRNAYHYKAGYDKAHLKDYLNALKSELNNTKLKGYYTEDQFNDAIKSVDKLDGNDQADAWVDQKTKLIRKVRFTEKDKKDSYVDVGLRYNGGDEYPFFVNFISNDSSGEAKAGISANLNTKANNIKINVSADGKDNGKAYKFNLDSTLTPGNPNVDFKKPDGAKSILEAYSQLLGGGLSIPGATTTPNSTEL